ncbi:MAG TPA: hypothetical protein DCW90_08825 [Lachnospiraceae bacterium]|nr:hypothetical protein [Lachnospiraceae bacterium]
MRMKEDAVGNGQIKPAYNLQHGVDSSETAKMKLPLHNFSIVKATAPSEDSISLTFIDIVYILLVSIHNIV